MYMIKNKGFVLFFLCLVLSMPGLSTAETLLFDGFTSNANGWRIDENHPDEGRLSISNGYYYFANYIDPGTAMTTQEIMVDLTQDFEVRAKIINNGGTGSQPHFGLTWVDDTSDSFLNFAIDESGWFKIYRSVDGTTTDIVDWSQSQFLNQGIGGVNKLSIKKTGNILEFLINDTRVYYNLTPEIIVGNQIGFFIDGYQDITIDYLLVTQDPSSNGTCDTVPGAVSLTAPTGTTTDTTPTLGWNSNACATWYKVYLVNTATDFKFVQWYEIENNSNNYPEAVCSGGTCTVTPAVTLASGHYEWWVRTWNDEGNGGWSSTGSFTIQGNDALPAKINLGAPLGNINGMGTTFTWNQDADATWYKLYISSSSSTYKYVQWYEIANNSNNYPEAVCSGGTCTITMDETFLDSTYDWYVRGWNENGNGDWSDGLSFTVKTSELEKDISEIMGMITEVGDLAPMIEEITAVLEVVMNGDPDFITISPPGVLDDLDLANLPSEVIITADLGNGYSPEGSSSTYTGSMELVVSNISFSEAGIGADISLDANNIKRDGQLILDGAMTLDINAEIAGSSLEATVDINFNNLKSLDFQVNGGVSITIPSINLSGEMTSSQPIVINFQQFSTQDYQISGDVELTPNGDIYDIVLDLDTNQGDVAGTVRVNGSNPDRIIISTPGSNLRAGDYVLDINNVIMEPDVCPGNPSSGNIVVSDNIETKTVTFNSNCSYTSN